jgi:Coenzyme PQQ synthesis protein D (PqqD)
LRPSNEVVSRKLGDRSVVVNLRTNRIYELNRTASRVWELLEAGLARAELEAMLLDEFDVEQSVLSQEVDRMLAQLSAEGLIDEREAA